MAGTTISNQSAIVPLTPAGGAVTKGGTIQQIIFNDANGPRPFINTVTISLYKTAQNTKISYSFNTDGELGGGIQAGAQFFFKLNNNGNVIYSSAAHSYNGPCRGGHSHGNSGQEITTNDIFDNADGFFVPSLTVDVYAC